jgi:hypothetical protein
MDVTSEGRNLQPEAAPLTKAFLFLDNADYWLLTWIIVFLISCCLVGVCNYREKGPKGPKGSKGSKPMETRPIFCDSILKFGILLVAVPVLCTILKYNSIFSHAELRLASGSIGRYLNIPGPMVRGEWTFARQDKTSKECCHSSSQIKLDDKFYDDIFYFSASYGSNEWTGEFCPPDLKANGEIPITFDPLADFPVKFIAASHGSSSYILASNAWLEGARIYYELSFIEDSQVKCKSIITKESDYILYNQTSRILMVLTLTAILLYGFYRGTLVVQASKIGSTEEEEHQQERQQHSKNSYNQF